MARPGGYVFPDLSDFVHVSDWGAFARGYPVAVCKVSQGATFGAAYWREFLPECRARGVLPVGYHFLTRGASINDQVGNFLRRLDGGPVGIALDVETDENGNNPTMAQADQWLDAVAARTGVARTRMLAYVPKWWYETHGAGSTALSDTIWWLSHYSTTPYLGPMAGWTRPSVLQFSSTTPGAGMPPGDMNVAINMTAAELRSKLTEGDDDMALTTDEVNAIRDAVWGRKPSDGIAQLDMRRVLEQAYSKAGDLQAKVAFLTTATGARFDEVDVVVAALSTAAAELDAGQDQVLGMLAAMHFEMTPEQLVQLGEAVVAAFPELSTEAIATAVRHEFGTALT